MAKLAIATTMASKKDPADPTRSGPSSGKGKAKAHQASPDPEDVNPLEPKLYVLPDLSNNNTPPIHSPPPKKESKQAQKACLRRLRMTTLHLRPGATPNKHWPARRRLTVSLPSNPLRLKTQANQLEELTRRWPATPCCSGVKALSNIYKYLCKGAPHPVPPLGPLNANEASPSSCRDNPPSVHHSRGSCHETRPPPGQLCQPSLETEEEIHNLRMELQQFHDYGCQDQETIQHLEQCLAIERQLGYAEGLAQAT